MSPVVYAGCVIEPGFLERIQDPESWWEYQDRAARRELERLAAESNLILQPDTIGRSQHRLAHGQIRVTWRAMTRERIRPQPLNWHDLDISSMDWINAGATVSLSTGEAVVPAPTYERLREAASSFVRRVHATQAAINNGYSRGDFVISDEVVELNNLPFREGPGFWRGHRITLARDEAGAQWILYVDPEHRAHVAEDIALLEIPYQIHEHYDLERRSYLEQRQADADTFLRRSEDVLEQYDAWNPAEELRETWIVDPDYQPTAEHPDVDEEWPYKSF